MRAFEPLALARLNNEPLYVHAARSLVASGVCSEVAVVTDSDTGAIVRELALAGVAARALGVDDVDADIVGCDLLVHDPCCPLVTPDDIRAVFDEMDARSSARVGCRPLTDTLKSVSQSRIESTLDRSAYQVACSPLLIACELWQVLRDSGSLSVFSSLPSLVRAAAAHATVKAVGVGLAAARVVVADDLRVLAAATQVGGAV